MRALLVEDDPAIRHILTVVLERSEFDVVACATGREALDRTSEGAFDLVVTDLSMPGINGRQVVAHCHEALPHAVVVVVSGYIDPDEARAFSASGVLLLRKPFRLPAVRALFEGQIADRIRTR